MNALPVRVGLRDYISLTIPSYRHSGQLGAETLLECSAALVGGGQFAVDRLNAPRLNWRYGKSGRCNGRSSGQAQPRVSELHTVQCRAGVEWRVAGCVIHVVALDTVVHDSEAPAENGFAQSVDVIGK
jgi:hypothetical protein